MCFRNTSYFILYLKQTDYMKTLIIGHRFSGPSFITFVFNVFAFLLNAYKRIELHIFIMQPHT